MAGASKISGGVYPNGPFEITVGGFAPNGLSAVEIDRAYLPFDCYVEEVRLNFNKTHSSTYPDAVTLKTVDSTAKDLVESIAVSAEIAGTKQTIGVDVAGVLLKAGDAIALVMTTTTTNAAGFCKARIKLRPAYEQS